jgi:predicted nucleotidyltransferase
MNLCQQHPQVRMEVFVSPESGRQQIVPTDDSIREDRTLVEIVKRLVNAYEPLRVYLFGSKARGESGPNSDYDLLLVVADDAPAERRRSRLAYEVLRGTGAAADVLVCTHSYFEPRRSLRASLPGTILREGRLLHGA